MVRSNPNPGGCAFPSASILTEPRHLRQDKSRPGDIVALGMGTFLKNIATDCVIFSGLEKSCLSNQDQSSDFSLGLVEKAKFKKDKRSSRHVASFATMRLTPLAMNHLVLRGPHFQAVLKDFATFMVTNPEGCSLLQGPFAVSHRGALEKILRAWGSALHWTLQRDHARQKVKGMQSFFACSRFFSGWG
jgi:hypothetical protein